MQPKTQVEIVGSYTVAYGFALEIELFRWGNVNAILVEK